MGSEVENLTLAATSRTALVGTGNELDNVLTGNAYNNILNGGAGADSMVGGAGNDTYYVDSALDVIVDTKGTDLVHASIDYTLGSTIENLTLDTGAHIGTGNALANIITANDDGNTLYGMAGADKLFGGFGDDILDGGAGKDTLTGGDGTDTYVFHASEYTTASAAAVNMDTINGFTTGTGVNHDVIDIHDILQGHGYAGGDISDYVHLTISGGNTILSVDADGLTGGAHFVNVATITGLHLTDANVLVTDGNLQVV
ncbi:MAG: type I secretion C-terminal target domain-containing protein [Micavibrio sp.]|nr:type I secretion C-terminal target domain-containing protein [Micavibrio sp.]